MTRKTFFILLSILAVIFLVQHILVKQPGFFKNIAKGEDFSSVEISLLDGGFEPIGYYEDKEVVILMFWSSNSDPSRLAFEALPDMLDYWGGDNEFEFIAVNIGDSKSEIENFIKEYGYEGKVGLDPDQKLVDEFSIHKVPTFVFIALDGSLKYSWDRFQPDLKHEMKYLINRQYDSDDEDSIGEIMEIPGEDTVIVRDSGKKGDTADSIENGDQDE